MIVDYSIEQLYSQIKDARSKEYIDEVLGSYYCGNYRSAVVMLYSVAICDLLYKLHRLIEIYDDEKSKSILNEITEKQTSNPKSADWEIYLREELFKSKRVLTASSHSHLESLQKERHLCAHPVLTNNNELHKPNRETVYAHIVNIMSEVLTAPVYIEKELLGTILKDLATQRNILRKREQVEQFITKKYGKIFNCAEVEDKLFRGLWKIVFSLNNPDTKKNRDINFLFLNFLFEKNPVRRLSRIESDSKKLSSWVNLTDLTCVEYFVKFLNRHDDIYRVLDDSFKIGFDALLTKYELLDHTAFFNKGDFPSYFEKLKMSLLPDDDLKYICSYVERRMGKEYSLQIPIAVFSHSESFYEAENNYNHLIKPILGDMSESNFKALFNAIKNNDQIRWCYKVQSHFPRLKSLAIKTNEKFDFSGIEFIK